MALPPKSDDDTPSARADSDEELTKQVAEEEAALAGSGRVLLRPSGTEPLVRVMVEAPSEEEARAVCDRLVGIVRGELG